MFFSQNRSLRGGHNKWEGLAVTSNFLVWGVLIVGNWVVNFPKNGVGGPPTIRKGRVMTQNLPMDWLVSPVMHFSWNWLISFFLKLCMKLEGHGCSKVVEPDFWGKMTQKYTELDYLKTESFLIVWNHIKVSELKAPKSP